MTGSRTGPAGNGRRAKIVCTLGPVTRSPEAIRALVDAGMDVARLNFSHGTHEEHAASYRLVREASDATGHSVGILADLQGPKIRLGCFEGGSAYLESGSLFTVTAESTDDDDADRGPGGTSAGATTSYRALATDLGPGDTLLIDDGMVRLGALSSDGHEVQFRVLEGGIVSDHKGINLPGVVVSAPSLSDKDMDDLRFALDLGVDMVALSFVRRPEDADPVRQIMDEAGRRVPLIAKLEKPEAVERLEAIIDAFDGLMVARGDLGVEVPLEQVPLIQKRAVQLARERAKPVIVATQLLESMIYHSRPTRAEASDVANAVLDGADALMLSGETAVGAHPQQTVATMARIISAVEDQALSTLPKISGDPGTGQESIAMVAPGVGRMVGARALVASTRTGATARRLSSQRSDIPLLAFTTEVAVRSQLALSWGVETFLVAPVAHSDEMVGQVEQALVGLARAGDGDVVVITAGTPPGQPGGTNLMLIHTVGLGRAITAEC
ncbi:MAG: pyruvate kinase [Actinomycetota bacterium]|nr:pyruvate kinase [Actinomycetota bacterium]